MDRTIPIEEQKKKRRRRLMTWGGGAIVVFAALIVGAVSLQPSVARQSIAFSTVDVGVLEISINAGGTVAPAYEEIINSPIDSRIVEVYKKVGDSVQAGQPAEARPADGTHRLRQATRRRTDAPAQDAAAGDKQPDQAEGPRHADTCVGDEAQPHGRRAAQRTFPRQPRGRHDRQGARGGAEL